jgi:hypothetical protein
VTLAARGLLVEETRTNLFLRSAELSNGAVWVPVVGATVAANTVTAPDGTLTGDTITFSTTNGNRIEQVSGTAVSGETVTFSLWMKGSGTINLNVATDTGVGGSTESKITLTSSWTRYSVTTTYNASVTGVRRGMIIWRTGDTAVNVDVWGAQLEAGSFATSYIPTAASTVTRNADVASVATSQFPYSASEGTIVVSTLLTPKPGASLGIYAFDDGTTNNAFPSFYSNLVLATSRSGGSNIFIAQSAALPASEAVFKQAFAYKNADYAASFNGGSPTTQASGAVPSGINRVQLGAYNTQYLNGHIRQITYIPRRLSNAELQSRTA